MISFLPALAILAYGSQSITVDRLVAIAVTLICLVLLSLARQRVGMALCLCTLLILSLTEFTSLGNLWPLPSVIVTIMAAACLRHLRFTQWFGHCEIDFKKVILAIGVGLLSFSGVLLWAYLAKPDISQIPFKIPPNLNVYSIGALILLFAALNSFAEEFLFRGLAMEALRTNSYAFSLGIQALAFSFLHYKGFPFGIGGAVLAGIFATIMGLLRLRTGSLLYSWCAHFVTNVLMGILLLSYPGDAQEITVNEPMAPVKSTVEMVSAVTGSKIDFIR